MAKFSLTNIFSRFSPRENVNLPKRALGFSGGSVVSEDSSMQVSAFYRGVTYISSQVAKLPWEVKDMNNNVLKQDRIHRLISLAPNSEMNAMAFRLTMLQNAIIHGNSYAEIERDILGRPVALWPIPSQNVELMRTPEGSLVYKVLTSSAIDPTGTVYLQPKDVFHIKNFHTKDGLIGHGVVAYSMNTLGIGLGADKMANNLFANGAIPSGVLEVDGILKDEAFKRLKDSWSEAHSGRKSAGVAVLEQGVKFKPTIIQPDVLQFLESRKFTVLEVARFLGVPPTKLYDTDAASYSNQEQSNLEVATDTIDTWCRVFEMECDVKLLANQFGGRRSEFDLYEIFRGDMTTRSNYFSKMMQVASMTPNEIRAREGLSPVADGDRVFLAVNNFKPLDRVDEIIDSEIKSKEPKDVSTPIGPSEEEDSSEEDQQIDREVAQAVIDYLRK